MINLEDLKILLVQIRRDADTLPPERAEFVHFSELKEEKVYTLDVFKNPAFPVSMIDDYDALMIGGLSDDLSNDIMLPDFFEPFLANLHHLMLHAIEKKIPSLLSCGGFMLASSMLGASVVIDPDQSEMGLCQITLTDAGKSDVLFQSFPPTFQAVSGHIKSTNDLPRECVHLASSERCFVHGFKVADAPFYAFQFHPEITCADLVTRVESYKDKYFATEQDYQTFIKTRGSTAIANSIITRFVRLVAQGAI